MSQIILWIEIGTIIRSLGCCPSERELHDLIAESHSIYIFIETSPLEGRGYAETRMSEDTPPLKKWDPFVGQLSHHIFFRWLRSLEVEEEEPTGYIRYEKFLPVMTQVLMEKRYRPIPEDVLLRAFEVLDPDKLGFIPKEELIKFMTEEGEPFSQEEMEEMLSAAIGPESTSIHYKEYIAMMVIDDN
ncbi:dynein regulatory complex protein 8 isoform X2 [Talpa occidentalis]|uniref:dynein regulatory complex protein 8 isoform X2 n=1 Tax=Talpa occidentalis TaxID=50954 RepID=UPI0023F72F2B|nr:dynein regulatory complex protein 8 isoform X2 [Talpa occidentalis]